MLPERIENLFDAGAVGFIFFRAMALSHNRIGPFMLKQVRLPRRCRSREVEVEMMQRGQRDQVRLAPPIETLPDGLTRFVYVSLYRMHLIAIHGWFRGVLLIAIGRVDQVVRPRLKLH